MADMTNMLNQQWGTPAANPVPAQGAPAPQGDQTPAPATPDQWAPAAEWTPPAEWDQTTPPTWEQTPAVPNADKYKDLMHTYGENVIQDMVSKYDQVQQMLQDPKQLESLTKDEIVKLYSSRDNLEKQLWEILPVIQENNRNRMDDVIKWVDHPGVQSYLQDMKQHLDTPEDMENIVNVVKELIPIIQGQKAAPVWADGKPAEPVNLNDTMWWSKWDWSTAPNINFAEAMLSPDPAIRKQAMDMMNKVLYPKK